MLLSLLFKEQPDLNWRNPEVREAMYRAMRFWLDKGVDGFRMDVLWLLIKDDEFRSNLPNPAFDGGSSFWSVLPTYTADQPGTHAIVREMRALLDGYSDRVLIGEIYLPVAKLVRYYEASPSGADGSVALLGAQMPFNFHLIQTAWEADRIAALIVEYEAALPPGAWPNWVLGNHDQRRLATRIGAAQARVAAMLLLTLRGTPTLYYGDELGMPNAIVLPEQVRDPAEKNQPGIGQGRDGERTPMLWDGSDHAGFTSAEAEPWLPMVEDWERYTVAAESAEAGSLLNLYRKLLALRRSHRALYGGMISAVSAAEGVLSFVRTTGETRLQVCLNLTGEVQTTECLAGRLLLNTYGDQTHAVVGGALGLRANEGVLIRLD